MLLGQSLASFSNSKYDAGQYTWFSKLEPAPRLVVDNVLIGRQVANVNGTGFSEEMVNQYDVDIESDASQFRIQR